MEEAHAMRATISYFLFPVFKSRMDADTRRYIQ